MPKLSIIVPVYNAESFLHSCIDSILAQTFSDIELILVNDGSKDNSGKICDEYAKNDARVKVLHKQNAGVSKARNDGIKMATGEYLGFVDADDTVEPDMFETLYNEAKKNSCEIVMCDALTVYSEDNKELDTISQLSNSCTIEKHNISPSLLMEMAGAAWRCIYKRDMLEKYGVLFPTNLKFSEDRVFNIYLFGYANKINYIKKPFYNRLMWEGSAVHRYHADYFEAMKKAYFETNKAIDTAWDGNDKLKKAYVEHFVQGALGAIYNYFYKTSTLSFLEKYNAVKKVCNDSALQKALSSNSCGGIRGKWLKNKNVIMLCLTAIIYNIKHGS